MRNTAVKIPRAQQKDYRMSRLALCPRCQSEVFMNKAAILLVLLWSSQHARADDFNLNQRLVIDCYKLHVDQVVRCLREGANVNATFGEFRRETNPFFD